MAPLKQNVLVDEWPLYIFTWPKKRLGSLLPSTITYNLVISAIQTVKHNLNTAERQTASLIRLWLISIVVEDASRLQQRNNALRIPSACMGTFTAAALGLRI